MFALPFHAGTELFCRVCALADALQQEWGVGYGQRVSCLALNSHRVLELWLATAMIGCGRRRELIKRCFLWSRASC